MAIEARKNFVVTAERDIGRQIANGILDVVTEGFNKYLKPRGRPRAALSKELKIINQEVGRLSHAAMMAQFRKFDARRGPQYRIGDPQKTGRYSGGRLERALSDAEKHIRVTPTTLSFFNQKFMDAEAPQWHRMSFGAGTTDNSVIPMKNPITGAPLPGSSSALEELGRSPEFSLPGSGTGGWYVLRRGGAASAARSTALPGALGEIHVSSNKRRLRAFRRTMPVNDPISGLTIAPERWVQAGVSKLNAVYPAYLTRMMAIYLDVDTDNPTFRKANAIIQANRTSGLR